MIFKNINLEKELRKERNKPEDLLSQVKNIFEQESTKESAILKRLNGLQEDEFKNINLDQDDLKKVYSIKEIEAICIKYRLRFLDTKLFKPEYPYEAIQKIKHFENKYQTELKNFKIIAPYNLFNLKDINEDPLLFAQLGNNSYYLIHRWGNDLHWSRNILNFPFRSIYHFFISCIVFAFVFSFSFPMSLMDIDANHEFTMRIWFWTHCTIAFFSFFLFLGSLTSRGFSSLTWNSKYFNEK